METKQERVAYARQAAIKQLLNPDYFQAQIEQESGFDPDAHNDASSADGIAQIVVRYHPTMYGKTRDWRISLEYAAQLVANLKANYGSITKALIAYNWGSGNMANNWDGTFADLPDETKAYVTNILGQMQVAHDLGGEMEDGISIRIGSDIPDYIIKQADDWSCSVRASYAALWVIAAIKGEEPPLYGWWRDIMVPRYADSSTGLKLASGVGLVMALDSAGIVATEKANVTREAVASWVREGRLVLIGGRQWGPAGHWALARGVEPDGTLILANPAGTYNLGGTPISDRIRDSWGKSSWSAVVVEMPSATPKAEDKKVVWPDGVPALMTTIGELANFDGSVRKALASIRSQIADLESFLELHATKRVAP